MATQARIFDRNAINPEIVTPSQVDAFAQCAYRLAHEDRAAASKGFALERGNLMHRLSEAYFRPAIQAGRLPDPSAILSRHWERHYQPGSIEAEGAYDLAFAILDGARRICSEEGFRIIGVEMPLEISRRPLATIPRLCISVRGRVDLLVARPEGGLVGLDLKTGRRVPRAADVAGLPSTGLYHELIGRRFPEAPTIEIAHFLPHLDVLVGVQPDDGEIEEAKDVARRLRRARHEGCFTPTPGVHCDWCSLRATCPAYQQPEGEQGILF